MIFYLKLTLYQLIESSIQNDTMKSGSLDGSFYGPTLGILILIA